MIHIYVFIDGDKGNQTNTNAQNAWFHFFGNHPRMGNVYVENVEGRKNSDFIRQFQLTTFPTILFIEGDGIEGVTKTRIEGSASESQIKKVLEDVLNGVFDGTGSGTDNGIDLPIPGDGGLSLGLGVFNFSLPNILLWGIIAYGAYEYLKE